MQSLHHNWETCEKSATAQARPDCGRALTTGGDNAPRADPARCSAAYAEVKRGRCFRTLSLPVDNRTRAIQLPVAEGRTAERALGMRLKGRKGKGDMDV